MRSKWRIVPVMMAGFMCTTAWTQDDLAAGRKLALNQCGVCHAFKAGEPNRQGPGLFGVVGRAAGSMAGFTYSEAFTKALGGKTWDAPALDRWLTDPQAVAPGTVMLYRQDDPDQRTALIHYLESLR